MPTPIVMTLKADTPNPNGHVFPKAVVEKIVAELNAKPFHISYGYPSDGHLDLHDSKGQTIPGTAKLLPDGSVVIEVNMQDKVVEEQLRVGDLKLGGGYVAELAPAAAPNQHFVVAPKDAPMVRHLAAFRD